MEITILIIGHTPSYTQTLTLCIKMLPAGKVLPAALAIFLTDNTSENNILGLFPHFSLWYYQISIRKERRNNWIAEEKTESSFWLSFLHLCHFPSHFSWPQLLPFLCDLSFEWPNELTITNELTERINWKGHICAVKNKIAKKIRLSFMYRKLLYQTTTLKNLNFVYIHNYINYVHIP